MKAFLHSLQEDAKTHYGNGVTQQGPSSQPVSNHTILMDLNGMHQGSTDQLVSNHSTSTPSNLHSRNSCNSYSISEDNLQKIQVRPAFVSFCKTREVWFVKAQ